jgi:hypothetical protein
MMVKNNLSSRALFSDIYRIKTVNWLKLNTLKRLLVWNFKLKWKIHDAYAATSKTINIGVNEFVLRTIRQRQIAKRIVVARVNVHI